MHWIERFKQTSRSSEITLLFLALIAVIVVAAPITYQLNQNKIKIRNLKSDQKLEIKALKKNHKRQLKIHLKTINTQYNQIEEQQKSLKEMSDIAKQKGMELNPSANVSRGIERREKAKSNFSGKASWYGKGQMTASGEPFNPSANTAAHMTLPFGTRVKVTNPSNGKSVTVRITDRGAFDKLGRVIDLSKGAFQQIAPLGQGVVSVNCEVVK